jgi:hypothetical protein
MSSIQTETQQIVSTELDSGELLLWAGRPSGGIVFRRADTFMVPFSLMWAGFVVFFEVTAYRQDGMNFMALWGIPFVLMGAYLAVGRFLWDAWRRAHTVYGVTNRRILILTSGLSRNTTTLALANLPGITLAERHDGTGDIVFGAGDASHVGAGGLVPRGSSVPAMLELIPQARNVYDIIRRAQHECRLTSGWSGPLKSAAAERQIVGPAYICLFHLAGTSSFTAVWTNGDQGGASARQNGRVHGTSLAFC